MSFTQISTNQPALFSGMEAEGFGAPFLAPVKSARSRNRAAWWRQDLDRTAVYLMGQARTEDERAFVEQLYEQAIEEGPDFINYRAKSAFEAAPRLASTATPSGGAISPPGAAQPASRRPISRF